MGWLVSALGGLLVALALADVFRTLGHPRGRGGLSRAVAETVWRVGRRRVWTGPAAMAAVVGSWAALVVTGWALVYLPHLPDGFVLADGLDRTSRGGLLDALYLSLVTATTLGFGDIVPSARWLRLAVPVEGLVGFALLTAAVSWVLQIYPALTRRRALAIRLTLLRRVGAEREPAALAGVLRELAAAVVRVRTDLAQHPVTYYFRDGDPASALPVVIGYAGALATTEAEEVDPATRLGAALLRCALRDLADVLDDRFLHVGGTTAQILAAYAADHDRGAAPGHPTEDEPKDD